MARAWLMVAISFNSDVDDAWEYADDPHYPEKFTELRYAHRVERLNYAMTH